MSFTGGCLVEIGVLLWFMSCGSVWIFAVLDFSVVPLLGVFGCSMGNVRCCWLWVSILTVEMLWICDSYIYLNGVMGKPCSFTGRGVFSAAGGSDGVDY